MKKSKCLPKEGNQKSSRHAYTVVELLVVCAIVGLIAAIIIPAISRALRYKENVEVSNKLQQAVLAFELFYEENHQDWPDNANLGVLPPELVDTDGDGEDDYYYFVYYGLTDENGDGWWAEDFEMGGYRAQWDWDYYPSGWGAGVSIKAYNGVDDLEDDQMQEMDRLLDDGDLRTGKFQSSQYGEDITSDSYEDEYTYILYLN